MSKSLRRASVKVVLALCVVAALVTALATPAQAQDGRNEIIAHAGDREAKPDGWKESEWENSIQAIQAAFSNDPDYQNNPDDDHFGPRWVEIDVQLNQNEAAITGDTPQGILYVHHDKTCEVIDANGKGTGEKYNVETDLPSNVDKCAERLENVLNLKDGAGASTTNRWVLEMKASDANKTALPKALYRLLEQRGQRTTEFVSSINDEMLTNIKAEADADGVEMSLIRVLDYITAPTKSRVDQTVDLGIKYIAARTLKWDPNPSSMALEKDLVEYARSQGLDTVGWAWEDLGDLGITEQSPEEANQYADGFDLDMVITDNIADIDAYEGWE